MGDGYLGNIHLKKTGVPIEWTPELIQEYAKCANDPIYFARKYIKVVHVDKGLIPLNLYPYQEQIIKEITENRRVAVLTSRQAGKALALDTEIPLSSGEWTTMGELKVGEWIVGTRGNPVQVIYKSDEYYRACYKLTFEGSSTPIVACKDHLWQVWDRQQNQYDILSTEQLAATFIQTDSSQWRRYEVPYISSHNSNEETDPYHNRRQLSSVDLTATVATQCITVDSDDSLFAVSRDYILTHNTTAAVAVILHYILFNESKTVAILANKGDAAREVLSRVKLAYESLPKWLQQGVLEWNKGSIELENGCKVLAGTTSSSAIRGKSISFLYIDECAFIEGYDEFFASVYPTISSGETTKMLQTSTPNGLNHFFTTCKGAKEGTNGYRYVEVKWQAVPGRDEKWKQETLEALNFDLEKFEVEYECEFSGSSGTLISGAALTGLKAAIPSSKAGAIKQYEIPQAGHQYAMVVDVSRGKGLDFSTFSIIDISAMPYRQVCTYRDNTEGPSDFANIVYQMGKLYNEAHTLVEINDIGGQVADILLMDLGYEALLFTESVGRVKRISGGFSSKVDRGIRTDKSVKSIGCSILKLLVEQDQLKIVDHDTIEELKHFSKKKTSYEAEAGWHDDMVMPLVLFAWLTDQMYFKEVTDINTLTELRLKSDQQVEDEMIPFGFIMAQAVEEKAFVDSDGDLWLVAD